MPLTLPPHTARITTSKSERNAGGFDGPARFGERVVGATKDLVAAEQPTTEQEDLWDAARGDGTGETDAAVGMGRWRDPARPPPPPTCERVLRWTRRALQRRSG